MKKIEIEMTEDPKDKKKEPEAPKTPLQTLCSVVDF